MVTETPKVQAQDESKSLAMVYKHKSQKVDSCFFKGKWPLDLCTTNSKCKKDNKE